MSKGENGGRGNGKERGNWKENDREDSVRLKDYGFAALFIYLFLERRVHHSVSNNAGTDLAVFKCRARPLTCPSSSMNVIWGLLFVIHNQSYSGSAGSRGKRDTYYLIRRPHAGR